MGRIAGTVGASAAAPPGVLPRDHPLTRKEAQAEVEVQQAAGERREDQADRGEDAPGHHHGPRPPTSAQGATHWACKAAEFAQDTLWGRPSRSQLGASNPWLRSSSL